MTPTYGCWRRAMRFCFCARKRQIQIIEGDDVVNLIPGGVALRSGRKLFCRYLIDASGRSRLAGKKLRLPEEFYSPPLTAWSGVAKQLPGELAAGLSTTFIPEPFGWTWLAPHPPNSCSWVRLALTKKMRPDHPEALASANYHSAVGATNVRWRLFKSLVHSNILLVGDAAGIIDPGAGQGILMACWSGIMAAETIIGIINSGKSETIAMRAYEDWYIDNYKSKAARLRLYYQNLGIVFN